MQVINRKSILTILFLWAVTAVAAQSFLADGKTLCTQQLQQAIDQIHQKGGGRLTLPKGTYLAGGLMLYSGVEIHLEEGATLLGSTNPYDYQSVNVAHTADNRNDNASMALMMADGAAHIKMWKV